MIKIRGFILKLLKSNFLFLCFIFFFSLYMFQNSLLYADDICLHFISDGIKIYKNFYYGSWVMEMQNLIFYYIPYTLGINLQDWALNTAGIFKSFVMTGIVYCYLKLAELHINSKIINYCMVFIIYFAVLYYIQKALMADIIILEGFIRFILPCALTLCFLYKLYKTVLYKIQPDILLYICAFICSSASEISAFICIITVLNLIIGDVLLKINRQLIKQKIYILAVLILGMIFLACSSGFLLHFTDKYNSGTGEVINIFHNIKPFNQLFYKKLILDFRFLYIILFVLIGLTYKKTSKMQILFPLYIVLSCLLFCYSLITIGYCEYDNNFWLNHSDIYSIIVPLMYFACFISFCNYLSQVRDNKINIINYIIVIAAILIVPQMINTSQLIHYRLLNTRNFVYLRDKITLFYAYENKTVIIPDIAFRSLSNYLVL